MVGHHDNGENKALFSKVLTPGNLQPSDSKKVLTTTRFHERFQRHAFIKDFIFKIDRNTYLLTASTGNPWRRGKQHRYVY
jgi:hypothetical protein